MQLEGVHEILQDYRDHLDDINGPLGVEHLNIIEKSLNVADQNLNKAAENVSRADTQNVSYYLKNNIKELKNKINEYRLNRLKAEHMPN